MSFFDTYEEIQNKINNKYDKIRLLGTGAQGKAYLCQNIAINQQCVIKQIKLSSMNEQDLQKQYKEVSILRSLVHPHIVKYQDSFLFKKDYLCIVMDYAEGGDLEQKIALAQKNNTQFDYKTIIKWFTQLCSAVRFIHNQKIIHRDIKNNNIFLDSKDNIILGDFGISKRLDNLRDKANTFVGTPYFMAPEQCNQQPYTNKVDIWSLGIVLFRLVYLKYPFEGFEMIHLMLAISRGTLNFPTTPQTPFKNIIIKLLQADPNKRPSIDQVFEFEEIKQYLGKSRVEKFKDQARLFSGRNRILKDSNQGKIELETNRPSSPNSKNIQKHEQKLLNFALQNYNSVQRLKLPLSRNQSRDISPNNIQNAKSPKLPCLKINGGLNAGSNKKGNQANFKCSPNIKRIVKNFRMNIENDKNYQNNYNNISPKKLNKQFSDCSTSESNKEVTPKIFLFNKVEEESPLVGVKKTLHNNLFLKHPESQSSQNSLQPSISQARIRFSANKKNILRRSDQSGVNIPPFNPAAIQDVTSLQSVPTNQDCVTPVIKLTKQKISDKIRQPLNILQGNEVFTAKHFNKDNLSSHLQQIDALKKQMNRPSKDFFMSPKLGSVKHIIPKVFNKQTEKIQEPDTFQEAMQDYTEELFQEKQLDDQMVLSINSLIQQEFSKSSSNTDYNTTQKMSASNKDSMNQIRSSSSSINNNKNDSIICNNTNKNNSINDNNNNITNNISISNNISNNFSNSNSNSICGKISNNISNNINSNNANTNTNINLNNMTCSNMLCKNNSNNNHNNASNNQETSCNNSNLVINQINNFTNTDRNINLENSFLDQDSQEILENSFNARYESQKQDNEDEENIQNSSNQYFGNVDLALSYNYSNSTLTDINSILQSNQIKNSQLISSQYTNPEKIIEYRKNELIELLGEQLYIKISHFASRLIQHYDIQQIIEKNLMTKQFLIICQDEEKIKIDFDINPVIFNLLRIIDYEENYQLVN